MDEKQKVFVDWGDEAEIERIGAAMYSGFQKKMAKDAEEQNARINARMEEPPDPVKAIMANHPKAMAAGRLISNLLWLLATTILLYDALFLLGLPPSFLGVVLLIFSYKLLTMHTYGTVFDFIAGAIVGLFLRRRE